MLPAFIITIDTEGDNLWAGPARITTDNARWLPRFQALSERFGLKPTYLTDFDMARCLVFAEFARHLLRRGAGEIGAHLHPWSTPPIHPLTGNDYACGPYATEYPPELIREKVAVLTRTLEDRFETKMTSHRAGRWALDASYARSLLDHGYIVDCSVTPGFSWKAIPGKPGGDGGPDYSNCPHKPYYIDLDDVRRPGESDLLEVPLTILPTSPRFIDRLRQGLPPRSLPRRLVNRLFPPLAWLRPNGRNRRSLLRVLRAALSGGAGYAEFMLHSSELMPGGSPAFPDNSSIEKLYDDLEAVFAAAARSFRPLGLSEFAAEIRRTASREVQ
jgi:hypothetical protein